MLFYASKQDCSIIFGHDSPRSHRRCNKGIVRIDLHANIFPFVSHHRLPKPSPARRRRRRVQARAQEYHVLQQPVRPAHMHHARDRCVCKQQFRAWQLHSRLNPSVLEPRIHIVSSLPVHPRSRHRDRRRRRATVFVAVVSQRDRIRHVLHHISVSLEVGVYLDLVLVRYLQTLRQTDASRSCTSTDFQVEERRTSVG